MSDAIRAGLVKLAIAGGLGWLLISGALANVTAELGAALQGHPTVKSSGLLGKLAGKP